MLKPHEIRAREALSDLAVCERFLELLKPMAAQAGAAPATDRNPQAAITYWRARAAQDRQIIKGAMQCA